MGDRWFEVLQIVGLVMTVGFAFLAARQSAKAIRETKAMRREERFADLVERVAEVGDLLVQITRSVVTAQDRLRVAQLHLEAAIDVTRMELPACRTLVTATAHMNQAPEAPMALVRSAFDELRPLLVRGDAEA